MTIETRTNLADFTRQLNALKREMKTIAATANAGAARTMKKFIRAQAVAGGRSPERDTGTLQAAVVVKRAKRVPAGHVQHIVGIRQGKAAQNVRRRRKGGVVSINLDAFYYRFLEQGFYPRRPNEALRGGRRTKALQRARAAARGERKVLRPFIAPGFSRAATETLRVHEIELDKAFTKYAQKEKK